MKFVKGAPLFFCLLTIVSVHLYADQDNSNSFTQDKNYSFQIVENLASNAIKFSPLGKNVFVKTYGFNGKACIEIKDEGPGFNSHDKKNI